MKISIIIPTIGRAALGKVLDVLVQTGHSSVPAGREVIVVFDGQRTHDFINFQNRYPHVYFYETGEKMGASGARNVGIEKSTGDVLVFIGDDTIPTGNWLSSIVDFHSTHPDQSAVFLGKVSWTPKLAADPFHQWLEDHAQFGFENIPKDAMYRVPTKQLWKYFYTSNISLKRSFIGEERFSEAFAGWGFEDTEFGYRLSKKGMELFYNPQCEVLHDHRQTLEGMVKNTENSRKNAVLFEQLHPEVRLLPEHRRKWGIKVSLFLKLAIFVTTPLSPFSKKIQWWREWKRAWGGANTNLKLSPICHSSAKRSNI